MRRPNGAGDPRGFAIMTHADIITQMQATGARVKRLEDGKLSIVGEVSPEAIEAIKADRDGFIDAWDQWEKDRYLSAPPVNLPLRKRPPDFRRDVSRRIQAYVLNQNGEVGRWVILRASQYKASRPGWTDGECTNAACSDVIHWQLSRHPTPENVVLDLGDSLKGFDANP